MKDSFSFIKTCKSKDRTFIITFKALLCGKDLSLSIYGGDKPHIGASSLAFLNPKTKDIEVKTIEIPTHKEALLSEKLALSLSQSLKVSVEVNCGIHLDSIEKSTIDDICTIVLESDKEVIRLYKSFCIGSN
ncbi:hypothetical protein [Helicobacter sp. 11S02629-2]|uniref:prenylated flavin chaperone LpdD n=1 Tax=Helicobacter sp. 11S02629-2 TaxID=1476195 RepID=UPI000BA5C23B|nr:hypothetical protein [Helicobacter sp. 11S02629-2]PAF45774.1 hypothetical protein BKH40_02560 [Helicobacter sp. 11S02629-2]